MADDYTAQDAVEDGTTGVEEQGVGGYAQGAVIGSSLSALGIAIASFILNLQSTIFEPIGAFTGSIADYIGGTIGAPVIITDAGAETSAESLATGTASLLGPFAFPVAVLVSVGGMSIFLWWITNTEINPLSVFSDEDE
ncbi:hypothetical protein [Halolamina salina]|uniref:Uncharacterized protein n=1 Tax=Halolamina salina TaxID=1220023 RepID=A0ABD6B927_9EURY